MGKGGGNRPKGTTAKLPVAEVINYDREHPKFCFRYTGSGNSPDDLNKDQQVALVLTLHRLAKIDWMTIKSSDHHKMGTEFIPVGQINVPIPQKFAMEDKFMFFRYQAKLPFGGVRIQDVFHILWVAKDFDDVYKH
jgi:hypothetical protein